MRLVGTRTDASLVLGALVLLLLVGYSTNLAAGFWSPRAAVVLVLAAAGLPRLVRLALSSSPARRPAWAAAAFVGLAAMATIASPHPALALLGRYNQGTGLLFVGGLGGAWALGGASSERVRSVVEGAVVAGALVNAAVAVLQTAFDLDVLHLGLVDDRAPGLLGNPVHLGAIAAASAALLVPRIATRPGRWVPALALVASAVQLSGGRAALAVLAVVAVLSCIRLPRRMVMLAIGAVIAGVVVGAAIADAGGSTTASSRTSAGAEGGLSARTGTWLSARHSIARHPWLGIGPGRFQAATSAQRTLTIARAEGPDRLFTDGHNLLVEYTTTTGLPAAAALVAWLVLACILGRGPRLVFALGVLAVGLVEPQSVGTTPVAFLLLGAAGPALVLGRPPPAERVTTGVLVAAAVVAGCILLVGDFDLDQARLDSSVGHARAAERLLPAWPDPATRLSRVFVFRGELTRAAKDRAEAQRWRLEAVRRDPDDPALWNDVADADTTRNDLAGARTAYLEALRRDPWSVRALNGLGHVAAAQHDLGEARTLFTRSLQVVADQPDIKAQLVSL